MKNYEDIYVQDYFTIELTTTKKGNHVLDVGDSKVLILDKMGNKINPIFVNKEMNLYPSKVGTFIVYKVRENKILLFQITKILREIENNNYDEKIQDIKPSRIAYKAICYMLNEYSPYDLDGELMWEYPLIDRIERQVDEFVL